MGGTLHKRILSTTTTIVGLYHSRLRKVWLLPHFASYYYRRRCIASAHDGDSASASWHCSRAKQIDCAWCRCFGVQNRCSPLGIPPGAGRDDASRGAGRDDASRETPICRSRPAVEVAGQLVQRLRHVVRGDAQVRHAGLHTGFGDDIQSGATINSLYDLLPCNMQPQDLLQHAACSMQHAACNMQHAACNMQHATP